MENVNRLYVGLLTALALCKYSQASWNGTREPASPTESLCHHRSNGNNCTEQKTPSCRCHDGYDGARCEYLILGWLTDKQQIIIYCAIAGLVVLILFIVFICIHAHRRSRRRGMRRQREGTRNGTEKLHMMDTNATHSIAESAEPTHTNSV
ncbi:probetacellulin isoform 2-T2 [Synchiropus picturatus]